MPSQQENQMKQHKESLERQYEQQQRLAPVRVQDTYNKENLETQHKYNLEIFEKQAALTREIQEKQSKLTKTSMWVIASATFLAAIIAAILGIYLERNWLQSPPQPPLKQSKTTIQKQNASAIPSLDEKEIIKATKPSAQGESSSKNLKKP